MRVRKSIVGGMAAAGLLLAGTASAHADPVNAKNAEIVELNCTGGITGTVTIVTNGNGTWTPGHVVGTNQVLHPYEFHISGSFTPAGGGPTQTFTEDDVKNAPRNGRLATCTFQQSGSDENGTFALNGTVLVSYTPAH